MRLDLADQTLGGANQTGPKGKVKDLNYCLENHLSGKKSMLLYPQKI
jgi:hypothetical protein